MLDKNTIKELISKYYVSEGQVFEKEGNNLVLDENICLKVMSSYLIYNEAKISYQGDVKQFGQGNRTLEKYIDTSMEKLSVRGKKNDWGTNKLINALLTSRGHHEETIIDNNLFGNKYSMFVGEKRPYGISYLKMKYREKGLDIENFRISQDKSELKKNGLLKVIIDFDIKPYRKEKHEEIKSTFEYEQSDILKNLERQKHEALKNNDEVAANYYENSIKTTLKNNPISVSPEVWDTMDNNQRKRFIELKMKEAKILQDKEAFIYWQNNLHSLENVLNIEENSIKL